MDNKIQFRKWLSEARYHGPVGGAFGKTRRNDVRFADTKTRVQYGRAIEDQIFQSLRQCGLDLERPTVAQDKFEKIDAWWHLGNDREGLQIKYRDTGNDIVFEVYVDYDRGILGRDMKSSAKYYAVCNQAGTTVTIIQVDRIKNIIQQALLQAENSGFGERGNFFGRGIVLRLRPDQKTRQMKMMAFIDPRMVEPVMPLCPVNINF